MSLFLRGHFDSHTAQEQDLGWTGRGKNMKFKRELEEDAQPAREFYFASGETCSFLDKGKPFFFVELQINYYINMCGCSRHS